jgi:Ni/Co efflux regulator RcnB
VTINVAVRHTSFALAVFLSAAIMLLALPANADKPSWAGGGKKTEHSAPQKYKHSAPKKSKGRFADHQRKIIHSHFGKKSKKGRCPPGLARKNNGCMPPGQAKKWHLGQRLPRDVVFHDLPRQLVVDLGPPPSGYRYIQVAEDILMIAIGTGMVMDAINDITSESNH